METILYYYYYYYFEYETIDRSSAWSFGHSDPHPSSTCSMYDKPLLRLINSGLSIKYLPLLYLSLLLNFLLHAIFRAAYKEETHLRY